MAVTSDLSDTLLPDRTDSSSVLSVILVKGKQLERKGFNAPVLFHIGAFRLYLKITVRYKKKLLLLPGQN